MVSRLRTSLRHLESTVDGLEVLIQNFDLTYLERLLDIFDKMLHAVQTDHITFAQDPTNPLHHGDISECPDEACQAATLYEKLWADLQAKHAATKEGNVTDD